jgi:hypothetical protein
MWAPYLCTCAPNTIIVGVGVSGVLYFDSLDCLGNGYLWVSLGIGVLEMEEILFRRRIVFRSCDPMWFAPHGQEHHRMLWIPHAASVWCVSSHGSAANGVWAGAG